MCVVFRRLFFSSALIVCFVVNGFTQKTVAQHLQRIQELFDSSGIGGIGAALIVDKELLWTGAYGFADVENRIPFSPATIMNAGSIAKTVTTMCILKAVEAGKLDLDTDINTYLPFKIVNPYQQDKIITLRHIATHTSGLNDRFPFYEDTYVFGKDVELDLETFLRNYFLPEGKNYDSSNFINKAPGSYREYSNIAYALAGYILERAVGMKLPEYCQQQLFKKLKIDRAGWQLKTVNMKDHTRLYDLVNDTLKNIPHYTFPTYPDGGLRISVEDLSRIFITLLNDGVYNNQEILKKESVETMLRFQFTEASHPENVDITELNSGLGWATKQNTKYMGHAGTDFGLKTEMLCDTNREVGVILFTNTSMPGKLRIKYHNGIFTELMEMGKTMRHGK